MVSTDIDKILEENRNDEKINNVACGDYNNKPVWMV